MLHRITMRVLPALTLAVTEGPFRKRKRIVMLFPGLVAFALYRGLHSLGWQSQIVTLLVASGLFSSVVAVAAYAYGRGRSAPQLAREEGLGHLCWIGMRFGFFYAVQLSLMVLALLKVFSYGYLEHPDGPAMMALIIASTSVARDALELGHLRRLREEGSSFLNVPGTGGFWTFIISHRNLWGLPVGAATAGVGLTYAGFSALVPALQTDLGQFVLVGILAGGAGTLVYIKQLQPARRMLESLHCYPYQEMLRFFVWPGLAFAWTYTLIMLGITEFILVTPSSFGLRVLEAAAVTALITLYCYYLGRCRWQEEKLHATIPASMLRCPFVMGLLNSKKV